MPEPTSLYCVAAVFLSTALVAHVAEAYHAERERKIAKKIT